MEKERNFIRPLCSMILEVASKSSDSNTDTASAPDGDVAFESIL